MVFALTMVRRIVDALPFVKPIGLLLGIYDTRQQGNRE